MTKPKAKAKKGTPDGAHRGAYVPKAEPRISLKECRLCNKIRDPNDVYKVRDLGSIAYECRYCRKAADALSMSDPKPRTLSLPKNWAPIGMTDMMLLAQHLSAILSVDARYSRRDYNETIFMLDRPVLIQDLIDLGLPTARISFGHDIDSTRFPLLILTERDIAYLLTMPPIVEVLPQAAFDAMDERGPR